MSEENNLHIREVFSILTQGVEMVQYEYNHKTKKTGAANKILWMDSDIYRICIDAVRPSMAERASGKIPPGVYLRDISEVRKGADSHDFNMSAIPPTDADNCLVIVGSESTLSLELPSKFTREWFLRRFRLLAEDILVEQEQRIRKYKFWESSRHLTPQERNAVPHFQTILERGIQFKHHQRDGQIDTCILRYNAQTKELELRDLIQKTVSTFWKKDAPLKLHLSDISEIRPGSHSIGFVKTGSTEFDAENLSIVGTENVFDIQLINGTARDLFAERLFHFVLSNIDIQKEREDMVVDTNQAIDALSK